MDCSCNRSYEPAVSEAGGVQLRRWRIETDFSGLRRHSTGGQPVFQAQELGQLLLAAGARFWTVETKSLLRDASEDLKRTGRRLDLSLSMPYSLRPKYRSRAVDQTAFV